METDEAMQFVTEVEAGFDKKKQLQQYEPATGFSAFTAEIPHEVDEDGNDLGPVVDPREVHDALMNAARRGADEGIMAEVELQVAKDQTGG